MLVSGRAAIRLEQAARLLEQLHGLSSDLRTDVVRGGELPELGVAHRRDVHEPVSVLDRGDDAHDVVALKVAAVEKFSRAGSHLAAHLAFGGHVRFLRVAVEGKLALASSGSVPSLWVRDRVSPRRTTVGCDPRWWTTALVGRVAPDALRSEHLGDGGDRELVL